MPPFFAPSTKFGASRLTLGLAGALALSGCILPSSMRNLSNLPIDPNTPVAKDVAYAAEHPGPYPQFADIPRTPTDVPPPEVWREHVAGVEAKKQALDTQVSRLPPVETNTESYAADVRARTATAGEVPPPDAAAQTAAYAASLRERATPPPPPK